MPNSTKAKHPSGKVEITFTEDDHSYVDDFGIDYTSGTTLVKSAFEEFDAKKAAAIKSAKTGIPADQYIAEWKAAGERAAMEGTRAHENCERQILGRIADIIDIIAGHRPYGIQPSTRMPKFETQVLQAACGTPEQYQRVIEFLHGKKEETNTDEELARRIEEEIEIQLVNVKTVLGAPIINPKTDKVFIRIDALDEWIKGKSWIDKYPASVIRNMAKTAMLPQVSPSVTKWPHHATERIKRRSGIMWNYNASGEPRVVGVKGKEIIEICDEQERS